MLSVYLFVMLQGKRVIIQFKEMDPVVTYNYNLADKIITSAFLPFYIEKHIHMASLLFLKAVQCYSYA